MKTVCLYTRKHPQERFERFLANTATNRARTYAVVNGKRWTNKGLIEVPNEALITTAEHEKKKP